MNTEIDKVEFHLASIDRELIDATLDGLPKSVACRIRMSMALMLNATGVDGIGLVRKASAVHYKSHTLDEICGCRLGCEKDRDKELENEHRDAGQDH